MQELAPHIYIETAYAGVTLGAINWQHGLVLIDSPFRQEDARSWRSALLNLGGGVDRLLINLDAHLDRTLGARNMDCTVVGHEKTAAVFRNRPANFKPQGYETGSDWELHNGLGSVRWAPPEITFTERMLIQWNESPLVLETHPGPSSGAIWAVLPEQRILLVGDAVVIHQPPFLSAADLPAWIQQLERLLSPDYREYLLISGRGGLVAQQQVREMLQFLQKTHELLTPLIARGAAPEETEALVPQLAALLHAPGDHEAQHTQRLRYGLRRYLIRHTSGQPEDNEE